MHLRPTHGTLQMTPSVYSVSKFFTSIKRLNVSRSVLINVMSLPVIVIYDLITIASKKQVS